MSNSNQRKNQPVFSGVLMYFPDAVKAIASHSWAGNMKHNPGEPLHWAKEKSKDHADCIARHLIDIGPTWDAVDPETDSLHATALAWRALALLQTVLERDKQLKTLEVCGDDNPRDPVNMGWKPAPWDPNDSNE